MRTFRIRDLLSVAVITAITFTGLACAGGDEGEVKEMNMTQVADDSSACVAPAAWFPHSNTPEPSDTTLFTINCQFHQWSWQMFLWLTQTMPDGQLRFETMARPSELLTGDASQPVAFSARQVGSMLQLAPRVTKSDEATMLDEINQAGSLGMMIDQNGRAVYYSMYINDVFYNFVRDNGFYDPAKLANAPDTLNFPVGSVELKASWKVVSAGDKTDGFYTRKAQVSKLVSKNGTIVVDPTQTEDVTVALVGLHIAGVVIDHPEFIWATFEHKDNAPTLSSEMLAEMMSLNSDSSIRAFNKKPVSDKDWTFYKANTAVGQSNVNNASLVQITNPTAQTLTPVTNAYIQYAQGGGNDENREHIVELNKSVLSQLNDSIWSNYLLGGAIWLNAQNGLVPNSTQQDLITGSTDLSNVTMETFTQKIKDERNCFGCHNTLQRFPPVPNTGVDPLPGMNLNVSHILVNHYFQASQLMKKKTSGK